MNKLPTKKLLDAAKDSSLNQEIQMLLYEWRDRGCPYDGKMIEMVYKIMKIARTNND